MDKTLENYMMNVVIICLLHRSGMNEATITQDELKEILSTVGENIGVHYEVDKETKSIHVKMEVEKNN